MTDTLMEIIGIFLAVLIMFIFPVVAVASQHDEIAQTTVETAVADFVNTIAEKGKVTTFDYNQLVQKISATGNNFDIQIELQLLDDNPERKTVITNKNTKGETLYYSIYTENITAKILDEIKNNENGEYNLKKDDYIVVTVKNTNVTIGTQFKNMFYQIVGKDAYTIGASSAALVTSSGKEDPKQADGKTVIREFKERKVKMQIHKEVTTTVARGGVNMVVILDSEHYCTPYHTKNGASSQMSGTITGMYESFRNMGIDFYMGFIETAYPRTIKAEANRYTPPNVRRDNRKRR